jgi:hypothetical protein
MTRRDWWDLLLFLGRLEDKTKSGTAKAEWKAGLRHELGSRDDKTLDALSARMQGRYDEIEATRASVYMRANSLLLFVGIIVTGAGLIGQSLTGAPAPLVVAFVIDGLFLLYAIVGTAVLAVRAHLVTNWDTPWIKHEESTDERTIRVLYATEILVAVEQNKIRIRGPVAFLSNAQQYAIAAIAFLALLAVLSVMAAVLKPPAPVAAPGAGASTVPSVSPVLPSSSPSSSPTPSPTPSPTSSPSPAVVVSPVASPSTNGPSASP